MSDGAATAGTGAAAQATASAAAGEPRSYYGNPILKEPVWTPEIPWYLFAGGLGGASAGLAFLAGIRGEEVLARRAWLAALAGVGVSPALLISDLGRPARFLNMLRMFKVTSPMSVGSWILAAAGTATGLAAIADVTGRLRPVGAVAKPAAAALGLPLTTYTGALLSQTAVPIWHEARHVLPAVFAAGGAASAGAAATAITPIRDARPARRLALLGAAAELMTVQAMEHRLGALGAPYHEQSAGTYARAARVLTVGGALLIGGAGTRSRVAAAAGGGLILAGALAERWSVFKAGFQSARDPKYTVGPQRERIAAGRARGASRRAAAARIDGDAARTAAPER